MTTYTLKINGMKCPKCEAHVNRALAELSGSKKVTSSHERSETVLVARDGLDEALLRDTVTALGYEVIAIESAPCEKKGLFSFLKK